MKSFWEETMQEKQNFPQMEEDIQVDVCIIGAGLTGLTCGYYLGNNTNLAIIDKSNICSGTSGKNTGKITSQHGLFYNYLYNSNGQEYAKKYFEANEKAIDRIEQIVKNEHIECEFKRAPAYVYTRQQIEKNKFEDEEFAINKINVNIAEFSTSTSGPINSIYAEKFKNQAQLNPVKYAYGLANSIVKNGGKIYENSIATKIEKSGGKYTICVNDKYKITAQNVILATRYPSINMPGFYFLKMYQSTSYAMVFDVHEELFDEYYISSENPIISLRSIEQQNKKLLLAVGYDYKTGCVPLTNGYKDLETQVKALYPRAELISKWSAEDCISLDKIAYIGEYSKIMKNLYIATGYNKWGISMSNVAANILVDKIHGKSNEYEDLFNSTRLEPIKNKGELKNMLSEAGNSLILSRFKMPKQTIKDIKANEGKIVKVNNKKIGVFKTETGELLAVKPKCSHLGCELNFNNIDKVWECPCHGSKFKPDGTAIEVPGVKNLNTDNDL